MINSLYSSRLPPMLGWSWFSAITFLLFCLQALFAKSLNWTCFNYFILVRYKHNLSINYLSFLNSWGSNYLSSFMKTLHFPGLNLNRLSAMKKSFSNWFSYCPDQGSDMPDFLNASYRSNYWSFEPLQPIFIKSVNKLYENILLFKI